MKKIALLIVLAGFIGTYSIANSQEAVKTEIGGDDDDKKCKKKNCKKNCKDSKKACTTKEKTEKEKTANGKTCNTASGKSCCSKKK